MPVDLMLRDVAEAPLLVLLLMLPLLLGAWAVRRGSKVGLLPIGTTVAAVILWYLYYASDVFPFTGGPAGLFITVAITGFGLLVALVALHRSRAKE